MAWHRARRRVSFEVDRFVDVAPRPQAFASAVGIDVEELGPPPVVRGLRRSPLPSEPFPTEDLLASGSCAIHRGPSREVSSHEVIRHLHVDAVDALDRFGEWWPTDLRVPGGVFELVDRNAIAIEGRLRRPLRRRLRIDLVLEIHAQELCAVRLTPELRSRRLIEPSESWWITAHALADEAVSAVRPRTPALV